MAADDECPQGGGQPGPGPAPRPAHHLLQRDRAPGVQDGGGAVIQSPGQYIQSYRVLDTAYSHTASWTQHTVHSVQHSFRGPGSRLWAEFLVIVIAYLYLEVQFVL